MASARTDPFDHAVHTAHTWLADVAKELGTGDRRYAYRVLRAWLHTLRDRLTVDVAAKFGAQLPELLRGIYYEGWDPSRVPSKFGPDRYAARFASDARISTADVRQTAAAVTRTLARHMSPGHLAEALAQLPAALRTMVGGTDDGHRPPAPAGAGEPKPSPLTAAEELLADLQARVDNLTAAVRALAVGFEETPGAGIDEKRRSRAARLAAEILLTAAAPQPPPATSGTDPSSPSSPPSAVVASGSGSGGGGSGSGAPA